MNIYCNLNDEKNIILCFSSGGIDFSASFTEAVKAFWKFQQSLFIHA